MVKRLIVNHIALESTRQKTMLKQKSNNVDFPPLVSIMLIKFITYHYDFVNLVDFREVHLLLAL